MDMNSPIGKSILALIRKADYAHAGEEEAIDITFKDIKKDPQRLLLDVGCGRGGTAKHIQDNGWGRVVGVDIDGDSIKYAKKRYPDVDFMAIDVMELYKKLPRQFDLIYLFNVFYALSDHRKVLEELKRLSRKGGQLIIFDYLIRGQREKIPFQDWNPIDLSMVREYMTDTGWRIIKSDDISALYRKWYTELVSRIRSSSGAIINFAGEEWFNFVDSFYSRILEALEEGVLGGETIYAMGL